MSSLAHTQRGRRVTPQWPRWWYFSTDQPVKCCCPCGAGWSISYCDGLGDTSSLVWGGDRVTDRYGTGELGGLACLKRAWQCDQRQNSDGIWRDPTLGRDKLMPRLLSIWHGPANRCRLFDTGTSCEKLPGVLCRQWVLSMSHRHTEEQARQESVI